MKKTISTTLFLRLSSWLNTDKHLAAANWVNSCLDQNDPLRKAFAQKATSSLLLYNPNKFKQISEKIQEGKLLETRELNIPIQNSKTLQVAFKVINHRNFNNKRRRKLTKNITRKSRYSAQRKIEVVRMFRG